MTRLYPLLLLTLSLAAMAAVIGFLSYPYLFPATTCDAVGGKHLSFNASPIAITVPVEEIVERVITAILQNTGNCTWKYHKLVSIQGPPLTLEIPYTEPGGYEYFCFGGT